MDPKCNALKSERIQRNLRESISSSVATDCEAAWVPLGVVGDDGKGGCNTVAAASAAFTTVVSFVASTSASDASF